GWGSTQAAAGWDFSTYTTTTQNPISATTVASGLTVGQLTKSSTLGTGATVANSPGFGSFNNWSTSASGTATNLTYATDNDKYLGFSITTGTSAMQLTDIMAWKNRRSSTGVSTVAWAYAIGDGAFNVIGTQAAGTGTSNSGNSMSSVSLAGVTDLQNIAAGTTVNFRLYGYGATGSGGTFYLIDLGNSTALDFGLNGKLSNVVNATGSGTLGINTAGTSTFAGTITNNNEATLTAVTGGTANFTGVISGAGSINKTGAGRVNLAAANTYSGATTVSAGTLNIGSAGSIASSAVTVANGATLKATNDYTQSTMPASALTGAIALNSGAIIDLTEGSLKATSLTVAALSGADVTKISYTIGKSFALTGGLTLNGNLVLDLTSTISGTGVYDVLTYAGSLTGSGTISLLSHVGDAWGDYNVAGALDTTTKKYTITVSGAYTPGGNPNSGTITIPSGGSLGDIGGTATVTSTAAATVTGTITGGTVNFSGANSSVNSVAAGNVTLSGGSSSVTEVKGTASVEISGSGNTVGTISGGTIDIKGDTTITTISAGNVSVNSDVVVTTLSGGDLTLGANKTLTVETGATSGTITGSGTLAKIGTGTLELSGNNSSFTGAIEADAGTVKVTNVAALGSTSGVTLGTSGGASDAKLEFATTGSTTVSANITATNTTSANIVENSGTGALTLSGSLTKNGTVLTLAGGSNGINVAGNIIGNANNSDLVVSSGTVKVSSSNSYNGPTFVQAGATLIADNASATGAGVVNVANGATLQVGTATNILTLTTGGFALTN
ncbi:MAG: hypothetical protein EBQ49_02090, partial [Verrucomicrobia bacterium]|nr:hypothetical protein [Verrucomicrobiota bacterium]